MYKPSNRNIFPCLATVTVLRRCYSAAVPDVPNLTARPQCPFPSLNSSGDTVSYVHPIDAANLTVNAGYDEPDTPPTNDKRTVSRRTNIIPRTQGSSIGPSSTSWFGSPSSGAGSSLGTILEDNDAILPWDDSVTKGQDLWRRLQLILSDPPEQIAQPPCLDLSSRWRADTESESDSARKLSSLWDFLLPDIEAGENMNSHTLLRRGPWDYTEIMNPPQPATTSRFYYNGLYSPSLHSIIATSMIGRRTDFDPAQPLVNLKVSTAPDRWSDVVFSRWSTVCKSDGRPENGVDKLHYIMQQHIINHRTCVVMDHILADAETQLLPLPYGRTSMKTIRSYSPGVSGEQFLALLPTPNVVGTMHMLIDHVVELDYKTVKGITVVKTQREEEPGGYFLKIELEPDSEAADRQAGIHHMDIDPGTIDTV